MQSVTDSENLLNFLSQNQIQLAQSSAIMMSAIDKQPLVRRSKVRDLVTSYVIAFWRHSAIGTGTVLKLFIFVAANMASVTV